MICSKCGAQIAGSTDAFCSVCGTPVTQSAYVPPPYQPAPIAPPAYGYAPPVTPGAPPKKKNSALLFVLLALLVAAAAFSVWYFVLRDWNAADMDDRTGTVSERDTEDTADTQRSARAADQPPVRESGQGIRLPGILGGGGAGSASEAPEQTTVPEQTTAPEHSSEPEPEPEPPPEVSYPPPVFWRATASSVTASPSGKNYTPEQVIDGRPDTAWNVPGTGAEWIAIEADVGQYVSGIRILNGYTKYSPEYSTWLYYRNHRPRDITILFSDGTYLEWTLMDVFDEDNYIYQDIPFDTPVLTEYILIYIDSVYEGDRWDDTCISEIEAY